MKKWLWLWRSMAVSGLLGLVGLIIIWNAWLDPQQHMPRSIELLIMLTPLIFIVRGVLHGRNISHVYATLLALWYITIGFAFFLDPVERMYGTLLMLFSTMLYIGSFFSTTTTSERKPRSSKASR